MVYFHFTDMQKNLDVLRYISVSVQNINSLLLLHTAEIESTILDS
jgi:hypothetical protein